MNVNYTYYAKLVRVIDGDTIVVMIDLGHSIWVKRHLRLLNVDAPETRTKDLEEKKRGIQVRNRLISFLQLRDVMTVQTTSKDSFGRWLANVWVDGLSVNDIVRSYTKSVQNSNL